MAVGQQRVHVARQEHRHPEVHVRQRVDEREAVAHVRERRLAPGAGPVVDDVEAVRPGAEEDVVALERERGPAAAVEQLQRPGRHRERPLHEGRRHVHAAVVGHAGTGTVEPLHRLGVVEHDARPLEDRAARVVEAGAVGRRQPVVARRTGDAGFRSARSHDASSCGPLTANLRRGAWAPIGRKVPAEGSDGPSGPSCAGAETGCDARRRPRDRASSARARSSPVRRGRRALGGRPRLLQAHRPLPRVRRGGARGRRPADPADGRRVVPAARVPARLPGARRAGGSRRRVRRPPPPAPDPARPRAPGPGPAPRPGRARSWTAGTSASRSRGRAPPRTASPTRTPSSGRRTPWTSARRSARRSAWPSTSARRPSCSSSSTSSGGPCSRSPRSRTRSASAAPT